MFAAVNDKVAVDDHRVDALRILVRILESRLVCDRVEIEQHDVGGLPLANDASVGKAQLRCRHPRHFVDRRLEAEEFELASVSPESARETPNTAWVGLPLPGFGRQSGSVG